MGVITREEQGQIAVEEGRECRTCTRVDRKQSAEGCIETARSWRGEREPANRGTNNEDKTRDGGVPGLQMTTGVKVLAREEGRRGRGRKKKRGDKKATHIC